MNFDNVHAIVVDDKSAPRKWGVSALKKVGFLEDNIHISYYGDHALNLYRELREKGCCVGLVLSDYHMDVKRKPPQDYFCAVRFSQVALFSGVDLAREVFKIDPTQKFCMVSAGLDEAVLKDGKSAHIPLILYKRRPEDRKFEEYVQTIKAYVLGDKRDRSVYEALLPRTLWTERGPVDKQEFVNSVPDDLICGH